jgi:hypothetical protein
MKEAIKTKMQLPTRCLTARSESQLGGNLKQPWSMIDQGFFIPAGSSLGRDDRGPYFINQAKPDQGY